MKPNKGGVAAIRRQLSANMRTAGLDYAESLPETQIVDLRTISFSFRILDRGTVFKDSLNHITESILARSASIQASKLAAACAYYLCEEVFGAYKGKGDGQSPPALTSFARRCDLVTRGDEALPLTCRTYVSWCPVPLQLVTSQQQVGHSTECGRRGPDMTTEPLVGRVVSSQKRP